MKLTLLENNNVLFTIADTTIKTIISLKELQDKCTDKRWSFCFYPDNEYLEMRDYHSVHVEIYSTLIGVWARRTGEGDRTYRWVAKALCFDNLSDIHEHIILEPVKTMEYRERLKRLENEVKNSERQLKHSKKILDEYLKKGS